jgi:hypothetical protein
MLAETFIEIIVELIRGFLVEGLLERVLNVRLQPRLRGIEQVRRHVHQTNRARLLNRLSTE